MHAIPIVEAPKRRILKRGRLTQLGRVSEAARPGQRCHSYRFCRTIRARGALCAFCGPAVARTLYAVILLHCELCTPQRGPKRLAAYCSKGRRTGIGFQRFRHGPPGQLLSAQRPATSTHSGYLLEPRCPWYHRRRDSQSHYHIDIRARNGHDSEHPIDTTGHHDL